MQLCAHSAAENPDFWLRKAKIERSLRGETTSPLSAMRSVLLILLTAHAGPLAGSALGQNWLSPPPEPPGNASTPEKVWLGQALFWDEQLSSSQSVACASCHMPEAGGSDPRSIRSDSRHPGFDGQFGTADDIRGSRGLFATALNGDFEESPLFEFHTQVTGRKAGTAINALLNTVLFWDGRAEFSYRNPTTGAMVLPAWAALESQAVQPLVNSTEMAHPGRNWLQVATELAPLHPLTLSPQLPGPLQAWIAQRDYAALFDETFGSPGVDIDRIAMAIAAYERSLFADQTPLDDYMNGDLQAMNAQQLRGMSLFQSKGRCIDCHSFPQLGRQQFHYTGVRPVAEDLGRAMVTGLPGDEGKMLTPGLRNIALRAPYFHNGGAPDLAAVIEFYDRGGDFNHANKAVEVAPIGLSQQEKADLLAFLAEALTDPRVAAESGPFERPLLRSEDPDFHQSFGVATGNQLGDPAPFFILEDPARLAGTWRVGLAGGLPGLRAWIAVDSQADVAGRAYRGVRLHLAGSTALRIAGPRVLDASGHTSFHLLLPAHPSLLGKRIVLQGFAADPNGNAGLVATQGAATPVLPAE